MNATEGLWTKKTQELRDKKLATLSLERVQESIKPCASAGESSLAVAVKDLLNSDWSPTRPYADSIHAVETALGQAVPLCKKIGSSAESVGELVRAVSQVKLDSDTDRACDMLHQRNFVQIRRYAKPSGETTRSAETV